jgi:LmbE family N-acetylglucosaminyl deacetylase
MKRFANMWLELEKRGLMPEPLEPDRRARFEQALQQPDPPVSHLVDVQGFVELKRRAAGMHRSQFGENSMLARVPDDLRAMFYGEERFLQARPEGSHEGSPLRGLEALLPGNLS